ncbi:MAG: Ig-like domain-containing protein [Actinomycetota bacterium]|nr:Ig-like domain-containing protein [Actinomycetota bacterium]
MGVVENVLGMALISWASSREGRTRRWAVLALVVAAAVALGLGLVLTARSAASAGGSGAITTIRPVVHITPSAGRAINPRNPIMVEAVGGTMRSVVVTNTATGTVVAGALSPERTTWRSTEVLGYGSTYRISATALGADGASVQQTDTVRTVSPTTQAYPSLTPAPTTNRTFGVGQIIGVSFDHEITDKAAAEKALSVTSNPPQPGSWYWLDNHTMHYRTQSYWQPGTTIALHANLYGVDLGDGVYGQTDRTATYTVHDSWIAKADGATEQMQIFHNDALVNTMPISLGSPGFPSHSGPHVISDKQPSIIMDSCTFGICKGQPGYYRERVNLDERISNDGEFVHSAPWSVGQQGNSNASHGCVNLSPANAQWFYDHFGLGDVVEITNSGGPPLPVWDTYGDWELPWNQWNAGSALHS